ncbi:hypothetical protein [Sinobacterium norvegicum]|uniref:hypothetical protein n=1 Tax=Sinobacterium norvegicum TaxID=1641715 RepID=UPI001F2EDBCC|nr:hypothetical protein [Sinobacterium norvegicum]
MMKINIALNPVDISFLGRVGQTRDSNMEPELIQESSGFWIDRVADIVHSAHPTMLYQHAAAGKLILVNAEL